jgi:HlyD family secretion protein
MSAEGHASPRLVLPPSLVEGGPRRRWIWVAAGVGLAALALMVVVLVRGLRAPASEYRVEPVERRTIARQIEAVGHLDVPRRILVTTAASGPVDQVLVTVGQQVQAGQPLARLGRAASALAVQSASAALAAARGRVAQARALAEGAAEAGRRTSKLAARGLASAGELDAAEAQQNENRARLRAAQADAEVAARSLESARVQDQMATVVAPEAGVVLVVPEAVGGLVGPPNPAPLFVLGDTLDRLRLQVPVAEGDIADVRLGQTARFSVSAFGRDFGAVVERIDVEPRRDRDAVAYPVTLTVDNRERLLLPGMTANVRIEVGRAADVLAVREVALRFTPPGATATAERNSVFRVDDRGRLQAIPVVPGLSDGAYTEVRPGPGQTLAAGQGVVVGLAGAGLPVGRGPGVSLGKRR